MTDRADPIDLPAAAEAHDPAVIRPGEREPLTNAAMAAERNG